MKKKKCFVSKFTNVHEAITLITLSLIYPNKVPNKPTICGLDANEKLCINDIINNDETVLDYKSLENILFKVIFFLNKNISHFLYYYIYI